MRKVICVAVALLVFISLCACGLSGEERRARELPPLSQDEVERREQALEQLNQDSDLPFELTLPEDELGDVSAYRRIEGFGCWGLENEDIFISISGYPDVCDAYHVTEFRLRSPKYSVLGLRVGDTAERAAELLGVQGYAYLEYWPADSVHETCYRKDGIVIYPKCVDVKDSQDVIYELIISVLTTNVEGVDF